MFLSLMLQIDMGYIYTNTSYLRNNPIQKEGKKKKIKKYNFASIDIHFRSTSILEFWFAKKWCLAHKKKSFMKNGSCISNAKRWTWIQIHINSCSTIFRDFWLSSNIQYHREALSRDFAEISRKFLNSIWHLDLTLS